MFARIFRRFRGEIAVRLQALSEFGCTRSIQRTAALAVVSAALAAGIAGAPQVCAAAKDNIVTVSSWGTDVGTLDPQLATGGQDRIPLSWIFNGLVRQAPGSENLGAAEPDLASSWESSPDQLTWTFHLRHGVQFHRGFGELTADDVVFSLKKAKDPNRSAYSADYAGIADVVAKDRYTVVIKLGEPIPDLLGLVTNFSGGFVISKAAYEKLGKDFGREPVGTGPFKFDKIEPKQYLELKANAQYFRGKPKLAGIRYRFMPSVATRDLAFRSGELDIVLGLSDQSWVERTKRVPGVVVDVMEPVTMAQLSLNITQKPLDDIRVRQAIAYAVDRPALVAWRGKDVARASESVVPHGYLGFYPVPNLPQHDLDTVHKLLAEAGFPNGLTIKMIHTGTNMDMLQTMQVVQQQLKDAGINIDMQLVDHNTYHELIRKDLSPIVYYQAGRVPVADAYLTQFFDSRSIVNTPTAVTNFSHCNVADADIRDARVATDKKQQMKLWADAQQKIVDAVCAVPLIEELSVWAHSGKFDYGYEMKGNMAPGPIITELSHFKN